MTCGGPFQGLPERFKLVLPAYKARQAARGHGLKTAMDCTGPGEFEHLHRLRYRPGLVHLDQPIDEAEGGRRQPDTARGASCSMRAARCVVCPTAE